MQLKLLRISKSAPLTAAIHASSLYAPYYKVTLRKSKKKDIVDIGLDDGSEEDDKRFNLELFACGADGLRLLDSKMVSSCFTSVLIMAATDETVHYESKRESQDENMSDLEGNLEPMCPTLNVYLSHVTQGIILNFKIINGELQAVESSNEPLFCPFKSGWIIDSMIVLPEQSKSRVAENGFKSGRLILTATYTGQLLLLRTSISTWDCIGVLNMTGGSRLKIVEQDGFLVIITQRKGIYY